MHNGKNGCDAFGSSAHHDGVLHLINLLSEHDKSIVLYHLLNAVSDALPDDMALRAPDGSVYLYLVPAPLPSLPTDDAKSLSSSGFSPALT